MRIEVARGKGRRAEMEVEQEQGLVRAETGKVAAELDKPLVAAVLKPKKGRPRKGKEPMLEQGQQIRLDHGQRLELGKEELESGGVHRDGESCANNDKSNGASCSSQSVESLDSPVKGLPPVKGPTGGPQRRSSKGGWTEEEDEILRRAVQCYNGKNWKRIAQYFPNRTDVQCLHRWQKVINPNLIKGPWTKEEDNKIVELVHKYGVKKWSFISQFLPGRIGKQCRERWFNHLNPEIKKEAWSQEEELALIRAHQVYGNKWAEIAKYIPGRVRDKVDFDSGLGSPIILKSSTHDTSLVVQMGSSNPVIEERGLSVKVEEKLNDYASSRYKEVEKHLIAEHGNHSTLVSSICMTENESGCKGNLHITQQNLDGEDSTQAIYQLVTKAKAEVEILEAENAELTATLKALKEQLSSYDGLILYPTYSKKLAAYPVYQRPMLELAMKANFYKSRHEIQQKTKAAMAVATGRPIDKSEEDSSQTQ